MKNLDLDNTGHLDESFSNVISQETIDSLAGLAGGIISSRTTPKNDEEEHCGVRPYEFNKKGMETWNKCVDSYRESKRVSSNDNNNAPLPEKSNTILIVSIIAGVLLIGGGITAFVLLRKKS
jgi:hypothetical protein